MFINIRMHLLYVALMLLVGPFFAQKASNINNLSTSKTDTQLIAGLLRSHPKLFEKVLNNPAEYKVQVIYTQINRDSNNVPSFKEYTYGSLGQFFYPASLVKLPCSILALEKINSLEEYRVNKETTLFTDSAFTCQKRVVGDSTALNKMPSVANYIRRMLLVSDNESYNRIYEFLGQEYLNERLADGSFNRVQVTSRFDMNCGPEENRYTNPITFLDSAGKVLYKQPMAFNKEFKGISIPGMEVGKGYLDAKDKYVSGPKSFNGSNYLSLEDATRLLKLILFPSATYPPNQFNLSPSDYLFLKQYMSEYPRESGHPGYAEKKFPDSFKKYFMYGGDEKARIVVDTMRIFNVVGQSYGFLSACAYVVDFKNKIEFMLSAVIYVNKDGIINDNRYEYKEVGFPFLLNLSRCIYTYEKGRQPVHTPILDEFRLHYK